MSLNMTYLQQKFANFIARSEKVHFQLENDTMVKELNKHDDVLKIMDF